ncbi:hypothetical protein [Embleya sp. NPDC005575]|uniref:hypothetical protein n=1 Tax=Embleya sp. NPDC005575 TaxID=3156892 RepID=UPI0033A9D528
MTRSARLEPVPLPTDETETEPGGEAEPGAEAGAARPHPNRRIAVFRLDGPLFFPDTRGAIGHARELLRAGRPNPASD